MAGKVITVVTPQNLVDATKIFIPFALAQPCRWSASPVSVLEKEGRTGTCGQSEGVVRQTPHN